MNYTFENIKSIFPEKNPLKISKYFNDFQRRVLEASFNRIDDDYYLVCPGYYRFNRISRKYVFSDLQIGGTGTFKKGENEFDCIRRESLEEMSIYPQFDENTKIFKFGKWYIINFINENIETGEILIENTDPDIKGKKVGFFYWVDVDKMADITEQFEKRTEFSEDILNLFFVSKNDVRNIVNLILL